MDNFYDNDNNTTDNSQFTPPIPPESTQPYGQQPYEQPPVQPVPQPVEPSYRPVSNDAYFDPQASVGNPPPIEKTTDGLGIAAMVLGIVSVVFCCCYGGGLLLAIPGLILGLCAKKQPATGKRSGFALAGIIISAVSILLNIVMLIYFVYTIPQLDTIDLDSLNDLNNLLDQFKNQLT